MNAHSPDLRRFRGLDQTEAMLGRTHWTYADYVRAGAEWFDAERARLGKAGPDATRQFAAQAWADMMCPPSKRVRNAMSNPMAADPETVKAEFEAARAEVLAREGDRG